MNMFRFTTGALIVALLFVVSPLSVAAQDRGAGAEGEARTNANVNIGGNADNGSANADARAEIQIEARGSATSSDAQDDAADREQGSSGEVRTTLGGGAEVSVSAREIRRMSDEQRVEFLSSVKTHAQVQSQQDLENFAKGVLAADANVEAVESSEEEVRVKYRVPARFLGIFEASIPATVAVRSSASAAAAGEVKADLPWYAFLYSTADTFSGASLESDVESNSDISSSIESETSFSSQTQARVINTVHALLKARVAAAVEASAGAEATTQ